MLTNQQSETDKTSCHSRTWNWSRRRRLIGSNAGNWKMKTRIVERVEDERCESTARTEKRVNTLISQPSWVLFANTDDFLASPLKSVWSRIAILSCPDSNLQRLPRRKQLVNIGYLLPEWKKLPALSYCSFCLH